MMGFLGYGLSENEESIFDIGNIFITCIGLGI